MIIKKLKNKKAAGPDKILVEFIKATPEDIQVLILKLMNIVLSTNIVPREWCIGIITPIH